MKTVTRFASESNLPLFAWASRRTNLTRAEKIFAARFGLSASWAREIARAAGVGGAD